MSRRIPIAPITVPSGSRSAEAFRLVGITSPEALRGLRTTFRVTPRSTTSPRAATNSRVSSGLMKRCRDCSSTSSRRKPSSCETASFACRIFPSRSETNTGSGAFAMMMSAASAALGAAPSPAVRARAPPFPFGSAAGGVTTFLAIVSLLRTGLPDGRCQCSFSSAGTLLANASLARRQDQDAALRDGAELEVEVVAAREPPDDRAEASHRQQSRERPAQWLVERLVEVGVAEEQGVARRLRAVRRREQHRDGVDLVHVLERVERQLERLSPQERVRATAADRAVRTGATER